MNDVAVSFPKYKVAVIDVAQVLENSNEIQELKRAQDKDMEELNILISKAQNDLLNEHNKSKLIQKNQIIGNKLKLKRKYG